jgi:GNAT superfamily N-acetyltransferase
MDADAVADIYLASRRAFVAFAPLAHPDIEVRQWVAHALVPSGQVTVAVYHGQRIIGMMATSRENGCGWIDQLYLVPEFTGLGIGAQLLTQAKAELGPPLRLYTFQENAGARQFYERHGFRTIAFTNGSENEERCPDVLYEWNAPVGG